MRLIKEIDDIRAAVDEARRGGERVVLVPTMGALHRAHVLLFERAREVGDLVVATIFVNPAQFGPDEDLDAYPRRLESDIEKAGAAGVDYLFCPTPETVYSDGFSTFIEVGGLGENLCGQSRPGHFRGVATVVLKLFNMVRPDAAIFGLKDFQQFAVIKRLVRDLNMEIELVGVEIMREPDGLAVSSRNGYLNARERESASVVPASLEAASHLFTKGERSSEKLISEVKKYIEKEGSAVVDYISVCDADSLKDIDIIESRALLAIAVKIGRTRLIDNVVLEG